MKTQYFSLLILSIITICFNTSCEEGETEVRVSCSEHTVSTCNADATKVNVRIRNATGSDMCNFVLNWGQYNLGLIEDGEETCYYQQDSAYEYPSNYEFYVDNILWGAEAIDFIGETALLPGNYTYEIIVTDTTNRFTDVNFYVD